MNKFTRICILASMLFLSLPIMAGKDPIGWRLNRNLPSQTIVGRNYSIVYTLTNNLPFKLVKPLVIERLSSPMLEFSYDDQCSNKRLNPNEQCTVQVNFQPIIPGNKFSSIVIAGYSNNRVPLEQYTTTLDNGTTTDVVASVSQSLPSTMTQGSSAPWSFSLLNNSSQSISDISVSVNQPIQHNGCANTTLLRGQSCTVSGSFLAAPGTSGLQTVSATFSYSPTGSASASTSTTVSSGNGVICQLVPPNLLPPIMTPAVKTIQFLCINNSGSTLEITQNLADSLTDKNNLPPGGIFTPSGAPGANNCLQNTQLLNGAACQLIGNLDLSAQPLEFYSLTATLHYEINAVAGSASATTSTDLVAALPTTRTIIFHNQCGFDVRFSLNGSALGNSPSCSSDAQCPQYTRCNTSTNTCYWENFNPDSNDGFDLANNQTKTVTIPQTNADPAVQWSGNFSASTSCQGGTCKQATCQNTTASDACAPGVGFTQPATQAEITMNKNTDDSYDMEVINGFHIPISMEPLYLATPETPATANNYQCGTPGKLTAANGFGACNWSGAILPNNVYYWVTSGGASCTVTSPPSAPVGGLVCGLDNNLNQVRGEFLGFWTANQICSLPSIPSAISNLLQCTTKLPSSYPSGSIVYDLMKCAVPTGDVNPLFNSCYLSYTGFSNSQIAQCCGCIDWWTLDNIQSNPNTSSCTNASGFNQTNPDWTAYVRSGLAWMKKACPSAYVYPFDDKSSGFSCSNNLPGQPNSTSYRITFCEGGNTGIPAGVNEGRSS